MQRDHLPLRDQYAGRWHGILIGLGVPAVALVNRHGPCPVCGGKDRFRFDDKHGHGTFICSHCGAGDGPKLAMLFRGWDFAQLVAHLQGGLGSADIANPPAPPAALIEETPDDKRKRMNMLWGKALPIKPTDPVGIYLAGRVGRIPTGTALRYHPKCPYPDGESWPAMLAIFVGPDGTPSGLHRTYLTPEGRKAPLVSGKMSLGPLRDGGAVRLAPHGDVLGIAEGIETALAASRLFDVPCWAALNAGRLAVWEPPVGVRRVVIYADNDDNFTGQTAAFDLAARLDGRVTVEIETPIKTGSDWADVLAARRMAA